MCGRVTLELDLEIVREILKTEFNVEEEHIHDFRPSYNIAPSDSLVVMLKKGKDLRAGTIKWGLLPSWASEEKLPKAMINARSETVHEKPTFKEAYYNRRCIIFATGFYEWERSGDKQPYRFIPRQGELLAFAGIWNRVILNREKQFNCAILTSKANDQMARVHHRIPVMLDKEGIDTWLDPNSSHEMRQSLFDMSEYQLKMYPVSKLVNSIAHDGPDLIEPLSVDE